MQIYLTGFALLAYSLSSAPKTKMPAVTNNFFVYKMWRMLTSAF